MYHKYWYFLYIFVKVKTFDFLENREQHFELRGSSLFSVIKSTMSEQAGDAM